MVSTNFLRFGIRPGRHMVMRMLVEGDPFRVLFAANDLDTLAAVATNMQQAVREGGLPEDDLVEPGFMWSLLSATMAHLKVTNRVNYVLYTPAFFKDVGDWEDMTTGKPAADLPAPPEPPAKEARKAKKGGGGG